MTNQGDKRNHAWEPATAKDQDGRVYNCQFCGQCEYLVVGYPQLDRDSLHNPDYRMILVKSKDCPKSTAEKYAKQYKVVCEDADDSTNSQRSFVLLDSMFRV